MRVQRCGFFFIYCGSPPRVVKVAIATDDCFFFSSTIQSCARRIFYFYFRFYRIDKQSKIETRISLLCIQPAITVDVDTEKNEHDTIEFGIVTECKDEAFDFYASN